MTHDSVPERLIALEVTMKTQHEAILQKIDHYSELIDERLKPIAELREDVDHHERQITFWKGAQSVFAFLVSGVFTYFGVHRR